MARRLALLLILSLCGGQALAADSWLQRAGYQLDRKIRLAGVDADASGLGFDAQRQRLWLVTDNASLFELDADGRLLRRIELAGFEDPEGLAWLGSDNEHTSLAISEERRGLILRIDIPHLARRVTFDRARLLARFSKQGSNRGIEGLGWDARAQRLFAVTESNPQAVYSIQQGNRSELWRVGLANFWREPLDYAGIAHVAQTGTLLIVSDRNRDLREYSLAGKRLARLALDASDPEGVALTPDGTLYICAEPNLLLIYKPVSGFIP